ncbi:hypothetical protein LIER_24284 [Lithospermum erythrorhizon]|uniref:DUF4216 domain-containing protein n=1 Tax=Lithospermum erythrorhizon TaxID=34254 RepID=A0AAV3R3S0_LITER
MYFEEGIETNLNRSRRHDVPDQPDDPTRLPLFHYLGRGTFVVKHRYRMEELYNTAHVYILCNTPEVQKTLQLYHDWLDELNLDATKVQRNRDGDGNKSTYNSGVCVKGSCYKDDDHVDYYGVIEEIWELLYGLSYDTVVLFKCFCFETSKWIQVHPRNGMIQIKHKSRGSKDDPFILTSQAQQVYYFPLCLTQWRSLAVVYRNEIER